MQQSDWLSLAALEMASLLTEPTLWGAATIALFVGFLIGFILAALLGGNRERRS